MYIESDNGIAGSVQAFERLEKPLPTLRHRKFFGTYLPETDTYRACVAIDISSDRPRQWGFKITEIPGGKYLQSRVKNWVGREELIGKTFHEMMKQVKLDENRPSIEYYRSQKELVLYLPVKE